jgi:hypothetical protein
VKISSKAKNWICSQLAQAVSAYVPCVCGPARRALPCLLLRARALCQARGNRMLSRLLYPVARGEKEQEERARTPRSRLMINAYSFPPELSRACPPLSCPLF